MQEYAKAHDYFLNISVLISVLSPPAYYDLGVIRVEFLRHFTIDQVMAAYLLKNPYTLSLQNSVSLGHPAPFELLWDFCERPKRPTLWLSSGQTLENKNKTSVTVKQIS